MKARLAAFLRSMLSESDGTVSSSRCLMALVIVFALGWITALLTRVHGPLTLAMVGEFVGTLTGFVTAVCGTLYGVNRFSDAWSSRKQ